MEKQLAEWEAKFGALLDESERVDAAEDERFGLQTPPALPPDLADAKARQQRLLEAQKELAEADAARRREGLKTPAQLPCTDSDSTVLPNKEGGFAPNYTPTAAVDTHRDYIVDADGRSSGAEDHLGGVSVCRLCGLPLGQSLRVGEEPRRPDDHPRQFHCRS